MKRQLRSVTPRIAAADVARVQRMVALVGTSYFERITLQTVSKALRGAPRAYGRLFKAVVGLSFHDYLTRVRLQHATHLIAAGIKIEAVALGVGYRSKKNFYRQFTRAFGATPEKFRAVPPLAEPFAAQATTSIRFVGSSVGARGHICAFFRTPEEEYRQLLPFIKAGFESGERAFHVVDPAQVESHLRRLEAAGIPVAEARERGRFTLLDWNQVYLPDGRFDQQRTLAAWQTMIGATDVKGVPRIRWIAHMEWSLEHREGLEDVLEYESRYNQIHDDRDTVICTYDLTRYSGMMLMDILRTHPMIMVDGLLQDNILYVPPELFLEELRARKGHRES
jgi:AraC-like DNA-binding protein